MTKEEFKLTRAVVYLISAQSLIDCALHTLADDKGMIDDEVLKLRDHAAKVADMFRDKVLRSIDEPANPS